jgi:hypothetical protein
MAGAMYDVEHGYQPASQALVITDGAHALAAGLTGNVQVSTAPAAIAWAVPAPTA